MQKFKEVREMQKVKTMETHAGHAFSQFRLTNNLLQNLYKFKITPTAKLVLLYLSSCYNPKKADMFPKQKTIAAKTGLSERSIVRAVQELIKAGVIIVECKYTNRYKFTSNIAIWSEKSDKNFYPDNMSDDKGQNDTLKDDNLSLHDSKPMNEPIKEPSTKVESVDDYKILKKYAEDHKAKNVNNYINFLKRNNLAENIIAKEKEKQSADKYFKKQIQETIENNKKIREGIEDAVMPWESPAMMAFKKKHFGK